MAFYSLFGIEKSAKKDCHDGDSLSKVIFLFQQCFDGIRFVGCIVSAGDDSALGYDAVEAFFFTDLFDFSDDVFFNRNDEFRFELAEVLCQFTAEVLSFLIGFQFRSLFGELVVCVFNSRLHLSADFREVFVCLNESVEINVADTGSKG